MRPAISGQDENGRRWGRKLKFTLAECIASSGLLMIAVGVTMAVVTSEPLALIPGITYAIAVGMALMVYRHYLRVQRDGDTTAKTAKESARFRIDVHPLLEAGWEDKFATLNPPEWVDMPSISFPGASSPLATFKVVGSRGICPKGVVQGDFIEVTASGPVIPSLCPVAETILHLAAVDDSEVREWCCPVYDHLLVFKKLDKIS
ncbi:MAG: hypothetical protein V3S68_04190 [Dehalococcoidia bacterium]